MPAFLLLAKNDPQRERALRMHGGKLAGDNCVECAEQTKLSAIVHRRVAKGGHLDFHARDAEPNVEEKQSLQISSAPGDVSAHQQAFRVRRLRALRMTVFSCSVASMT